MEKNKELIIMKTTIKISNNTKNKLEALKDNPKSTYEDVIKKLLPEGNEENIIENQEKPATFVTIHDSDKLVNFFEISWSMLKDSEIGELFVAERISDKPVTKKESAEVIFKDKERVILKYISEDYEIVDNESVLIDEDSFLESFKFFN